jgi:hypothetical protein
MCVHNTLHKKAVSTEHTRRAEVPKRWTFGLDFWRTMCNILSLKEQIIQYVLTGTSREYVKYYTNVARFESIE